MERDGLHLGGGNRKWQRSDSHDGKPSKFPDDLEMREKVTDDYALGLNSWKPVALNCGGRGRLQVGQSSAWGMFVMFGRREVWAGIYTGWATWTVWKPTSAVLGR